MFWSPSVSLFMVWSLILAEHFKKMLNGFFFFNFRALHNFSKHEHFHRPLSL